MSSRSIVAKHACARVALVVSGCVWLFGFDYGGTILVHSRAEIYELAMNGEITEEARDQLLDLLDNPVDLNHASRERLQLLPDVTYALADAIVAARNEAPFRRVAQLEALVGSAIFEQCRPFVTLVRADRPRPPLSASVSLLAMERLQDDRAPVAFLRGKQTVGGWFDAGFIVAEQDRPYGFDYSTDPVTVEGRRPTVALERVFATVEKANWSAVAGHYMVGFGLGLTLDVTNRVHPYGFHPDLQVYEDWESYDSYSVPKRLLGAAATVRGALPSGRAIAFTLLGSSAPQDLYYTEISPHEYQVSSDDDVSYPTFPNVYREDLAGMNATFFWDSDTVLGFTLYAARAVKRYDYDFVNHPIPNRASYGAAGLNAALPAGPLDLFFEAAVTDTMGFGSRAEIIAKLDGLEINLSGRYYGEGFDNPHSRGRSEPDTSRPDAAGPELDPGGDRDRDEFGPELRVIYYPFDWMRVRGKADVWKRPSLDVTNAYLETRLDLDLAPWLRVDLIADLRDKDITETGRDQAYECSDPAECKGQKWSVGGGFLLRPTEALWLQTLYRDRYEDISSYPDRYMRTHYAWVKLGCHITDSIRFIARAKYYDERPGDDTGARYASGYGQIHISATSRMRIQARYEQVYDLDDPEAEVNPERKGRLQVAFAF